jgi:hypothetical protein
MDVDSLHCEIISHYPDDPATVSGIASATSGTSGSTHWTMDPTGLLLLSNQIYVPQVLGDTSDILRVRVLQNKHDHILSGHFGQNRTLALVQHEYAWPEMRSFVCDYCKSGTHCKRNKAPRHKLYGLLRPLPVALRRWHSISIDFIEFLPYSGEFDCICIIVDCASNQVILFPCDHHITSVQLARFFLIHVFSKHGVPSHVTSDRGTEFVSAFFRALGELLNMTMHFTSGHHPEADGQTEHMNQTLEQYICMYCAYHQDDWAELLPLREFALNNAPNTSTGVSPFFANKGYHLLLTFSKTTVVGPDVDKAQDYVYELQSVYEYL